MSYFDRLRRAILKADWNEEEHPRDAKGKFTSGGGDSGAGLKAGDVVKSTSTDTNFEVVGPSKLGEDYVSVKLVGDPDHTAFTLSTDGLEKVGGASAASPLTAGAIYKKPEGTYTYVKSSPLYHYVKDPVTGKDIAIKKVHASLAGHDIHIVDGKLTISKSNPATTPDHLAAPLPKAAVPKAVEHSTPSGITDASSWTKVGSQAGSNPGGVYQDAQGTKWYVKTPKTADHVKNEVLANKLYALAGVSVPEVKQVILDGKLSVASRIEEGTTLANSSNKATLYKAAQKDFAADAWLANWDAVGMGKDNMMQKADGSLLRIDAGGSMKYRAQGGTKTFGNTVPEFDTLRDSSMNKDAADVFGGMTNDELKASVMKVASIKLPDVLKTARSVYGNTQEADQIADTLVKRQMDLLSRVKDDESAKYLDKLTEVKANGKKMTYSERNALDSYTGSAFVSLNRQGRQGVMDGYIFQQNKLVNAALDTYPGYKATTWRGVPNLSDEDLARYKEGHVVCEGGFTSTSKSEAFATKWANKGYAGDNRVLFTVHGASGRDLSQQSLGMPGEKEVLFKSQTWFHVISVKKKGGLIHITMMEAQ